MPCSVPLLSGAPRAQIHALPRRATAASQNRDRASSAYTLPWQAQHQCLQLLRLQLPMHSAGRSPDELTPMQTARSQPHTNAVVHQHLHARGSPVGEHIGMMRLGRTEDGNHPGERRVHACTHVQWIGGKPGGIDADHAGAPLNKDCSQCLHSAAAATGQCTAGLLACGYQLRFELRVVAAPCATRWGVGN